MRGSRQNGAAYRLVVRLVGGTIRTTTLLPDQKRAIANVATFVRQAARSGVPIAVELQRQVHGRADAADDWELVEHWSQTVVTRIVGQSAARGAAPCSPPRNAASPGVRPTTTAVHVVEPRRKAVIVEPTPAPALPPRPHRTHRWEVALVLTAAAVTWFAAIAYFTGGRLLAARDTGATPVATTLPMDAPATHPASRSGGSTSDKLHSGSAARRRPARYGE